MKRREISKCDYIIRSMRWVLVGGLFALVAIFASPAFGQAPSPSPAADASALEPILNMLAPVLAGLLGKYGWVSQVLLIIGALRVCFKPVMMYLEQRAKDSPGTEDDARLAQFERGPIYKVIAFILDFGGSIKLSQVNKLNQGTMKTLLMTATLVALIGCSTGCKTGADGKRTIDIVKVDQAKALIEPVAAGALRRALQNSPEHAPKLAQYAASVAGVFCTMTLSNSFQPEFLIAEVDKFADPELAKIGDGYLVDIKNTAIGLYKVFYGDRFRAEVPPDQWLHLVCEFFCDAITQGLTDAGYPGGVKKTADGKMGGFEDGKIDWAVPAILNTTLIADAYWPIIREPEARSAVPIRSGTPSQAPPVSDIWELQLSQR